MRKLFLRLADVDDPSSLSNRLRRRRLEDFRRRVADLARPVRVLDVGGTERFWLLSGLLDDGDIEVTLLNVTPPTHTTHPAVSSVVGDATAMTDISDRAFDVVFSNSVIEHVGPFDAQRRMAEHVRRIGRHYYVQTPSKWFPIEPHFLFPFFGVLPEAARIWLVRHLALGRRPRRTDPVAAREEVRSVRLLTLRQLRSLFPDSEVHRERFLGLTKSYVAVGGWSAS